MTDTEAIAEVLKVLDKAEPKVNYSDRTELDAEAKQGMAEAYAHPGFRKYLIQNYNGCVKAAALESRNEVELAFNRGRAATYKEVFIRLKDQFTAFERLRRKISATQERVIEENRVVEHQEGSQGGEATEAGSGDSAQPG